MNVNLILTVAASAVLLASPVESYGAVTNIEEEIRHTLLVMNPDVRKKWLETLRDSSGLTDDEFSALLVKTANEAGQEHNADLRFFTMGAIKNFGTTNALEFLENEVARGPDFAGGLRGYSIITGFDDRCFALLEKVTSDWGEANRYRRSDVYTTLRFALSPGTNYFLRCVNPGGEDDVRQRMLSFLMSAAENEAFGSSYLDEIIMHYMPEYERSERRRTVALKLMNSTNSTEYTVNYFRNELQKLEAEEARARDAAATPGADAPPLADKPSRMWRKSPVVAFGALVIGITCVAVRRRRKK